MMPFAPLVEIEILFAIVTAEAAPAVSVMLPAPLVGVEVMFALRVMELAAVRVREFPLLHTTGAFTVIVPALPPAAPLFVVVTVMLLEARAVSRSVFKICDDGTPEFGL